MFVPKPIRKWIRIFRGDVAPVLILLSVLLGFWFGLTPGFYGIHAALLALALLLTVHIGIFLIFAGIGKALAYAAAPLLYHTGVWAHEHAAGLIGVLANTPIVGISDFSRYSVAGALILGPVIGLVAGGLLALGVGSFRRAWLRLEEGSERFRTFRQKRWVRFLDRLLIGKGAKDVRDVLKRRPRIIRIPGLILAVLLIAGFFIGVQFVRDDVVTDYARRSLTVANRAEVDLRALDLELLAGSLAAEDLAATDPQQPTQNRIVVEKLVADVSLWSLSLGRLVMDKVELSGVAFDQPREQAGEVAAPLQLPAPPTFEPGKLKVPQSDTAKLQSYLENARKVRDMLVRAREYLPAPGITDERQQRTVPEEYLAYLTARSARPPAPRLIVRELVLDPVVIPVKQLGRSRVVCENLSDVPQHAGLPLRIEVQSQEKPAKAGLTFHFGPQVRGVEVDATLQNVDLRALQADLRTTNPVVFEGGTASARLTGLVDRDTVDLAIGVKTQGMKLRSTGAGLFDLDPQITAEVMKVLEKVETTLRLIGPIDEPRLVFDSTALTKQFRDALIQAGKDQLVRQLDAALGDRVPEGVPGAKDVLEDPLGAAGKGLSDLLGGEKDETKDKDDEEDKSNPLDDLRKRRKKP
jgi:uncharacterized protein (TIGR03546 family)